MNWQSFHGSIGVKKMFKPGEKELEAAICLLNYSHNILGYLL